MITVTELKHGDCPRCDGCGYVADNEEGAPWSVWLKLPLESSAAVLMGLAKPVECSACSGTGDKYVVTGVSIVKDPLHPWQTFEVLTDEAKAKGRWWVSWWGKNGTFELHSPWWATGSRGDLSGSVCHPKELSFCAAVLANGEEEARAVIAGALDNGEAGTIEWQFVEPRAVDWSPFCDRFPRANWMQWPEEEKR